jgi:lipopolysaccharide export system permease protein
VSRFDRYILAQLLALFALFTLVLTGVMWVNRAVLLFNRLIADGHSLRLFFEMTALALPNLIRLVLPVAAFVATLALANRLLRESEMVVMQAAGCSAVRLARPFVVFGLIAATVTAVFMHLLVPASREALAEREARLASDATSALLREGAFHFPVAGISFYVRDVAPDGALDQVMLSDARTAGESTLYTAATGVLESRPGGVNLVLFDGVAQRLHAEDLRLDLTRFARFEVRLEAAPGAAAGGGESLVATPTPSLLAGGADLAARLGLGILDLVAEVQRRTAQPLSALAATLVALGALMLGGFSRFGLWRRMIVAVLVVVGIQMVETAALGRVAISSAAWPLLWLAPAAGIGLGLVMLLWADRTGWRAGARA